MSVDERGIDLKRRHVFFLLLLLYVAHLLNLFVWLRLDVNYLTYDAHRHFLASYRIYNKLVSCSPQLLDALIYNSKVHPPLAMLVSAPFYALFGVHQDVAVLGNAALFLLILVFSVYRIGRIVLKSRGWAFLAVFFLSMYPVVFNQIKVYLLDFPLMAMVTLAIYLLMRQSWVFVLVFLAGMLVKASFFLFIFFPAVVVMLDFLMLQNFDVRRSWLSEKMALIKGFLGIRFFLAGTFCLGLLWIFGAYYFSDKIYISNIGLGNVFEKLLNLVGMVVFGPVSRQTWSTIILDDLFLRKLHAFVWYVWGMINWQMSFVLFFPFVAGLVVCWRRKFYGKKILWAWLAGGFLLTANLVYAVGFNMEVTGVRYMMPILPAAAIMTAAFLMVLPRFWGRLAAGGLVVFSLIQLVCVSYPIAKDIPEVSFSFRLKDDLDFLPEKFIVVKPQAWAVSGGDSGSHPKDYQGHLLMCRQIMDVLASDPSRGQEAVVLMIPDDTRLWHLQYLALRDHVRIEFLYDWNYNRSRLPQMIEAMDDVDYIIDKQGGWQAEEYRLWAVDMLRQAFDVRRERFVLLKQVPCPDGGIILVYRNRHGGIK